MKRISTPFTDLLGIDTPVAVAPMTFSCDVNLATQVSIAGGYGMFPSGFATGAEFVTELDAARKLLGTSPNDPLRMGVGFVAWMLDIRTETVDVLRVCLENRVQSIWLSFSDNMERWVKYIRDFDKDRKDPFHTIIWVQVHNVADAERAANELKADIIVVQGIEAGGHGRRDAQSLATLLPLVKKAIPEAPIVLAAGGASTGSQVASLLLLGADGCVLGTRYVTTLESTYTKNMKDAVVAATRNVRTRAFDYARGDAFWPEWIDGAALSNKTVEDHANGMPIDELQRLFVEGTEKDDASRTAIWAGAGVCLVNDQIGAADVTRSLHDEAVAQLERASSLVSTK